MPVLLGPADYEAVRKSIQIDLTADDLPDSVIQLDQYAGEAEAQVLQLANSLPDVNVERGTEGWRLLRAAATLMCAALIVGAIPSLTSESFGEYRYSRIPIDPIRLARDLRGRAFAMVGRLTEIEVSLAYRPRFMIAAAGGRGDTRVLPPGANAPGFIGPW